MKHFNFTLTFIALLFFSCEKKSFPPALSESIATDAKLANQGFRKSLNFVNAWLEHADPETGLIPRNLDNSKNIWNAKDAAADNYPFMVLTSAFTSQELFEGKMKAMLEKETELTSRIGALPDTYNFEKNRFDKDEIDTFDILFGSSEYVKDGLLPLTEWLGNSPWSERMVNILDDFPNQTGIVNGADGTYFGDAVPEINGELLQILSRVYWMTGKEKYLNWAEKIGDFYLLGENHPTKNFERLRLRDHGCELISGLCELYATMHFARPEKKEVYQKPLYAMLDDILAKGRNENGFFYNAINPQSGEIDWDGVADTWGYTLNGFYTIYLLDKKELYKEAVLKVFDNLDKYKNFDWEHGSSDGYADAIESALNLYNRIPDEGVAKWIDSETQIMWGKQQPSGIIEGWHGDGNFARTTIMYCLWKSKGLSIQPWNEGVYLAAQQTEDSLYVQISSDIDWEGKILFDTPRHRNNMKMPMDWPRINQFPEWFVVEENAKYQITNITENTTEQLLGGFNDNAIKIKIKAGGIQQIVVSKI
ncbi:MAG: hypothetical protein KTR26_22275 [Flammeovirgaceae bacterium]|nr:hypothetical protein [Flammeovirgaceae bacterium]